MSAEIVSNRDGILTARISGRLTQPELAALQASAQESIRALGHVSVLILVEDFHGGRDGDDWSDVSFMENDLFIRKMAIVGLKKWEEWVLMFTASTTRKFPIEYFQADELAE